MKIIISSPYYQTKHGGVISLHKLSHILNEIGFDSYMVNFNGATSPIKLNPNYNTKNINWESIDKENDIIEHIPPQEIGEISATSIRNQMKKNGLL